MCNEIGTPWLGRHLPLVFQHLLMSNWRRLGFRYSAVDSSRSPHDAWRVPFTHNVRFQASLTHWSCFVAFLPSSSTCATARTCTVNFRFWAANYAVFVTFPSRGRRGLWTPWSFCGGKLSRKGRQGPERKAAKQENVGTVMTQTWVLCDYNSPKA